MPDVQDLQMFKAEGSMKMQRLLPPGRRLPPAETDSTEAVPPTVTATAASATALPPTEADSAEEVLPTVTATAALAAALPRKIGSQAPLSDGGRGRGMREEGEQGLSLHRAWPA